MGSSAETAGMFGLQVFSQHVSLREHSTRAKAGAASLLEVQALELAYHFCHIVLVRARYKVSPNSRSEETESVSR